MISLVYLTTRGLSPLSDELMLAGYRVWEALEVDEVLHLCEYEHVDAVVIAADVELLGMNEIAEHTITLRLKPAATATDVIWELSNLFPGSAAKQ